MSFAGVGVLGACANAWVDAALRVLNMTGARLRHCDTSISHKVAPKTDFS